MESPRSGTSSLVIIGRKWRRLVAQKMAGVEGGVDGLKRQWRLIEIEAVGEIVGGLSIGVAERSESESSFDQIQDAAEIVVHVRNVLCLGVWRNDDQRHAKTIDIARSPAGAIVHDFGWRHVIVPAAPIVPRDD